MTDPLKDQLYARIFVVEPSHDVSALREFTDRIVFITTGYERPDEVLDVAQETLEDFNPDTDAIVPVGKVFCNLLIGTLLAQHQEVILAMYLDKNYVFKRMKLNGTKIEHGVESDSTDSSSGELVTQ